MASIIKAMSAILIGVTTIVSADYVKPVVANFLRQQSIPPSMTPSPEPEPEPLPPAKPRPTPQPKRAVPVWVPEPDATRSEPIPEFTAPKPAPKPKPPKPRPAPRAVLPSPEPHEQEWAEGSDAYAGDDDRWREHWQNQGARQDSDRLPARKGERWSVGRDDPGDSGRWPDRSAERLAGRPQVSPPAPGATPPVYCGFERLCSQRRARQPEWRL
jgi:outer membrane biosynthesis protein TonB